MKRSISIILVICLAICGLPFSSIAVDMDSNVFYINDKEITVKSGRDILSDDEIEFLVYSIFYEHEDNGVAMTGDIPLMCKIFGHDLEEASVMIVDHNCYSASPHCRESVYDVTTCVRSNCDYYVAVLRYADRIAICHG